MQIVPNVPQSFAEHFEHYSWVLGSGIALVALIISARALHLQITGPTKESKRVRYRALVLDRVTNLLPVFEEHAAHLLAETLGDLARMQAEGAGEPPTNARLRQFSEAYRALLQPLTFRILGALQAWGDVGVCAHVSGLMENLEDLNEHVAAAARDRLHSRRITEEFHGQVAKLLGAIVKGLEP